MWPNEGVSRLMVRLKSKKGNVRVAVLLVPRRGATLPDPPKIEPLAQWE